MTEDRDLHEQISRKAYQIYEARQRSGEQGDHQTDWLRAERMIREEQSRIEITVLTEEYDYSEGRVYSKPKTADEERQAAAQELAEEDLQAFFRIVGGSERPTNFTPD